MKCYKTVLKIKSLKNNYGFFIIASVNLFYFITLLIFITISYAKIKKEINKIIFAIKFNEIPIKNNQFINKPIIINNKIRSQTKKQTKKIEKKKIILNKNCKKEKNNQTKKKLLNLNIFKKEKNNIYFKKIGRNNKDNSNNEMNLIGKMDIKENNNLNNKKKILEKKDFELNSLAYEEAIKKDHRNFWEYYGSSLKYNHPILFSFGSFDDYNSKIIKIFLFFFTLCLDLTVNALFFTDETMHKIYQDNGQFNFVYQIPQILYSTLISRFIDSLIKNFSLSQDILVGLKQETRKNNLEQKRKKLLFALKIKFTLFFVLTFIFLIFCWFYITCFCGIYINTQIHLFKDSIISAMSSLCIPFVLYIVTGILRIASLKVRKPTRRCLYKFSLLLENFIG